MIRDAREHADVTLLEVGVSERDPSTVILDASLAAVAAPVRLRTSGARSLERCARGPLAQRSPVRGRAPRGPRAGDALSSLRIASFGRFEALASYGVGERFIGNTILTLCLVPGASVTSRVMVTSMRVALTR